MRRFSSLHRIGVVIGLLVAFVGCGGSNPPAPPAADTKASAPSQAAPAPQPQQGGVTPEAAPAAPAAPSSAVPVPHPPVAPDPHKVVATVNGRPITQRQVYGLAAANTARLQEMGKRIPADAEPEIRQMALQQLIDLELMADAARKAGLKADAKEIDSYIGNAKARFPSEAEYKKYMVQSKLSESDLRSDLESQLLAQAYGDAETKGLKPDEAAAKKLYDENRDKFKKSDEAHVLQILVKSNASDPPAKREEARKRAEEAYQKAKAGDDFGKLAKEYSQAPNAAKGGDVPFFPRGVMVPKFEELSFTLPVGQISTVFETPYGFNVIKILERRDGQIATWDEVKPQILSRIAASMQGQILGQKVAALRSSAKIQVLDPALRIPSAPPQGAPAPTGAAPKGEPPKGSS